MLSYLENNDFDYDWYQECFVPQKTYKIQEKNNKKHDIDLTINTSLNKSQVWHIDGTTNKKSIWIL